MPQPNSPPNTRRKKREQRLREILSTIFQNSLSCKGKEIEETVDQACTVIAVPLNTTQVFCDRPDDIPTQTLFFSNDTPAKIFAAINPHILSRPERVDSTQLQALINSALSEFEHGDLEERCNMIDLEAISAVNPSSLHYNDPTDATDPTLIVVDAVEPHTQGIQGRSRTTVSATAAPSPQNTAVSIPIVSVTTATQVTHDGAIPSRSEVTERPTQVTQIADSPLAINILRDDTITSTQEPDETSSIPTVPSGPHASTIPLSEPSSSLAEPEAPPSPPNQHELLDPFTQDLREPKIAHIPHRLHPAQWRIIKNELATRLRDMAKLSDTAATGVRHGRTPTTTKIAQIERAAYLVVAGPANELRQKRTEWEAHRPITTNPKKSTRTSKEARALRAKKLLDLGALGKAVRTLTNTAPRVSPEMARQAYEALIQTEAPMNDPAAIQELYRRDPKRSALRQLTAGIVTTVVESSPRGSASGIHGTRYEHFRSLISTNPSLADSLARIFNNLIAIKYYPKAWTYARLIALNKRTTEAQTPSDVRPIGIGEVIARLWARCLIHVYRPELMSELDPRQYGFGVKDGALKHGLTARYAIHHQHQHQRGCTVLIDIKNAFTEEDKEALQTILSNSDLPEEISAILSQAIRKSSFITADGTNITPATGVVQGDPTSSPLFAISMKPVAKAIDHIIGPHWNFENDISLPSHTAYAEDFAIFAPSIDLAAEAVKAVCDVLEKINLHVNKPKSVIIPGYELAEDDLPESLRGFNIISHSTYLGVNIGDVAELTETRWASLHEEVIKATQQVWNTFPTQIAFHLTNLVLVPKLTAHLRQGGPSKEALQATDSAIKQIILDKLPTADDERLHLPIKLGGLGLMSMMDVAPIAEAAGLIAWSQENNDLARKYVKEAIDTLTNQASIHKDWMTLAEDRLKKAATYKAQHELWVAACSGKADRIKSGLTETKAESMELGKLKTSGDILRPPMAHDCLVQDLDFNIAVAIRLDHAADIGPQKFCVVCRKTLTTAAHTRGGCTSTNGAATERHDMCVCTIGSKLALSGGTVIMEKKQPEETHIHDITLVQYQLKALGLDLTFVDTGCRSNRAFKDGGLANARRRKVRQYRGEVIPLVFTVNGGCDDDTYKFLLKHIGVDKWRRARGAIAATIAKGNRRIYDRYAEKCSRAELAEHFSRAANGFYATKLDLKKYVLEACAK
eukprot:gnl/Dysnectes_brevis/49_a60_2262.p1 GENE.gnl/Dysnectes_brevis/49_a60_2262~~gnl/Dysnectes_brevis/49_a60_2262.p1  ORF type:complete len:1200 (-),score=125.61 gnl/Dysnectes_brevis/49_a60_2262:2281-5880(-)